MAWQLGLFDKSLARQLGLFDQSLASQLGLFEQSLARKWAYLTRAWLGSWAYLTGSRGVFMNITSCGLNTKKAWLVNWAYWTGVCRASELVQQTISYRTDKTKDSVLPTVQYTVKNKPT